jgi:hypothetical protein
MAGLLLRRRACGPRHFACAFLPKKTAVAGSPCAKHERRIAEVFQTQPGPPLKLAPSSWWGILTLAKRSHQAEGLVGLLEVQLLRLHQLLGVAQVEVAVEDLQPWGQSL